jgi:hypothetical protein
MPGHFDGIAAEVGLVMGSRDPMTYTKTDWAEVERALRQLKGRKLGPHLIKEVTVFSMRPTASSLSGHTHPAKQATKKTTAKKTTGKKR